MSLSLFFSLKEFTTWQRRSMCWEMDGVVVNKPPELDCVGLNSGSLLICHPWATHTLSKHHVSAAVQGDGNGDGFLGLL